MVDRARFVIVRFKPAPLAAEQFLETEIHIAGNFRPRTGIDLQNLCVRLI